MRLGSLALLWASTAGAVQYMKSKDFRVGVDPDSGALLSIVHPKDNASMSWISGPDNTPWQPPGSRWGLGYVDWGSLHRTFWTKPHIRVEDDRMSAVYTLDGLKVDVTRKLDQRSGSLDECYAFTNTGDDPVTLNDRATESFAIYTPFNDHYTTTEDVLENRAHAHVWANGGASSWVKLTRMGLRGPHLGLVLTEGALAGYSIEARNVVTLSNTRGFFLLHPDAPRIEPGESTRICWSLFWHDDWEDFFEQGIERSDQFLQAEASSWTAVAGEAVNLTVSSRRGATISSDGVDLVAGPQKGSFSGSIKADKTGQQKISFTVDNDGIQTNSTVILNVVADVDELIANRIKFITSKQQLSTDFSDKSKAGAYAVYDNQMEGIMTFDTSSDRNTGRERVGMGVLIGRWLQSNSDAEVEESLRIYYDYVNNQLQDATGYVHSWPIDSGRTASLRLYNWPWVMQLHLQMAKLGNKVTTSHGNYTATPSQRLLDTVERFYVQDDASDYYPINVPIYEALTYFEESGNDEAVQRLLALWTAHGKRIAEVGQNYPASEVNYEQSIVAPAAIILLELYRYTQDQDWLDAAHGHFDRLEAFNGRQPDHRLHDIAIRHWDGYWFGKDRMWGDTFPHYWSTLTGIAMHHYAKATGDDSYQRRAEGILRGNLVLFSEEGRGYCAHIYPTTVDGRKGGYLDPYANDQDWALAHILAIRGYQSSER
ncbi:hypothetical protein BJX68DRAFT_278145 [Aspergillus pseudodeflectus]|uniref:Six-hairpin glycosidase-like protein n=1 Tax=Aspergillus pseudodeflectus TaxID=176178 RepID=A0ABR4JSQ7_9EURO